MANNNRPYGGLKVHGDLLQVAVREAGSVVYPGDPVSLASDGQMDTTTAGSTIDGVCLSYASAAGQAILVSVSPDQIYSAQANSTHISAQTLIGNNADHIVGTPNTTYKQSNVMIASSTAAAGAAGFTIVGLSPEVDNAFGDKARVLVRINEHQAFGKDAFAGI